MKKVFFMIMLVCFAFLNAIDSVYSANGFVENPVRDSLVYYHNNTDDSYWYGTDSWAVRFGFNDFFENIDTLYYETEGAYIYIPNEIADDELTVKIYADNYGQPELETLQTSQTISPVYGWNHIVFSETYTDTTIWLVIDYPTNISDRFISASNIDGTHSYFLQDEYYLNMADYGFVSEFLFSLEGRFLFDGTDLELKDLTLVIDENYYPDGTLNFDAYPQFTIRNNSQQTVENAILYLTIDYPLWSIEDSIAIPSINAEQEIFFDHYQDEEHKYDLLREYSQYYVSAVVEHEADSLTFNNEKNFYLNIFPLELDNVLIENAVLNNETTYNIWNDQESIIFPDSTEVINFFPDISDIPLYNSAAVLRSNFYDLTGYPVTIIEGEDKIFGYFESTYADNFSSLYNDFLENGKTFISEIDVHASVDSAGNVQFNYELKNEDTYIFFDYLADLKFYAAIVEDNVGDNLEIRQEVFGSVLLDLVYETSNLSLSWSDTFADSFSFNKFSDIDIIGDSLNYCRIVYWVQNTETHRIDYLNSFPFTEFVQVGISDNDIVIFNEKISIYPTPFNNYEIL
ncbi:MAG TPA: hypothetical protein ENL20_03340, partial [Candidatus Cloacimonetes bacterium]|nr:hypothetical protein [Candidatus Cloacimonadota bacterium]